MGIKKHKIQKSDRIYVSGTHEAIISRELYSRVQRLIEDRKCKCLASKNKYKDVEKKENKFNRILFCGDCGGRLKFFRRVYGKSANTKVYYAYICPNSESYGEQFCKKKKIGMQELEGAVEAALRMHIKLFLDTKTVLSSLNRTMLEKNMVQDYDRQMTDTRGRLECAKSMNTNLYNDYVDGLLSERDYLFAKQKYIKEAEDLTQKLSELATLQNTYRAECAGDQNMVQCMERYADFQELSSDIVHAFIRKIVLFDEKRIEIQYAFEDELRELIELCEQRKGEIACMEQK